MDLITVERYHFKPDWTIGRMAIEGEMVGFVLEDEIREVKVHGETAISFGRYKLSSRYSPKFSKHFLWSEKGQVLIPNPKVNKNYNSTLSNRKRYDALRKLYDDFEEHELIWITNVPNFQYVLIHWGNTDKDTDGCLLVGSVLGMVNGREAVMFSQSHYMAIYSRIFSKVKKGEQYINIVSV